MRFLLIGKENLEYIKKSLESKHEVIGLLEEEAALGKASDMGILSISHAELGRQYKVGFDAVVLTDLQNSCLERMIQYLQEKGIDRIYILKLHRTEKKSARCELLDFEQDFIKVPENKPFFVHLETHVLHGCNLNCMACNNFAPFAKKGDVCSVQQLEKDLLRIRELFAGVARFFLLGGEPLMEPKLTEDFMCVSRKCLPDTEIRLLTNGLLLPGMEQSFWRCVRENEIVLHITLYPPTKEKIKEITDILHQEKAEYFLSEEVKTFIKRLTEYPFEDAEKSNAQCTSAGCHYLENGFVSKCPDGKMVALFDKKNATALYQKEEIDLYGTDNGWDILQKLTAPSRLCRYCAIERQQLVEWAPADGRLDKGHWLIPHRYAYELEQSKEKEENLRQQAECFRMEKEALRVQNFKQQQTYECQIDNMQQTQKRQQEAYLQTIQKQQEEQKCREEQYKNHIQKLQKENREQRNHFSDQIQILEEEREEWKERYEQIAHSTCWKMTRPARKIADKLKKKS